MASKAKLVNLDAMILRADFAEEPGLNEVGYPPIQVLGTHDLGDGHLAQLLRKPDFQRETNHWDPEQVVSLLECFVNGDLIPSVILWRSKKYFFVIDGGHRLSVLRAWILDDYGDRDASRHFFGNEISKNQIKAADYTRSQVAKKVGSWKELPSATDNLSEADMRKVHVISSRGIPIQWVVGDAAKAESSFFKINTKGTALDEVEQVLLRNRRRPVPIAARAVIRAGMGHQYWSALDAKHQETIKSLSKQIHSNLFDPELDSPIKTLDLPLGGSKGIRSALDVLLNFFMLANQDSNGVIIKVEDDPEDVTGAATVQKLKAALNITQRITGNENGSLGLHPAVYFYGPSGVHNSAMFLGTIKLFSQKIAKNEKAYFDKFTTARKVTEKTLIDHKQLIASILQKALSPRRVDIYYDLLRGIVDEVLGGRKVTASTLTQLANMKGRIVNEEMFAGEEFSDGVKSQAFLSSALRGAHRCSECGGYLDHAKSLSYDHITPKSGGGRGTVENCDLIHPYCNQAVRNRRHQKQNKTV